MEVIEESVPPLPPKTKKHNFSVSAAEESKMKNFTFCKSLILPKNSLETSSIKGNNLCRNRDEDEPSSSPQSTSTSSNCKVKPELENSQKVITWVGGKEDSNDGIYENVSNGRINTLADSSKNGKMAPANPSGKFSERRRKTPKIEVRQEDYKTVVKISVKETPTPEEEMLRENRFDVEEENFYENGHVINGEGFKRLENDAVNIASKTNENEAVYENVNVSKEQCYENVSNCGKNFSSDECFYANVQENVGRCGQRLMKEHVAKANDCNANGGVTDCSLARDNEFLLPKYKVASVNNSKDRDDLVYENIEPGCILYANESLYQNAKKNLTSREEVGEKRESDKFQQHKIERKSAFVELTLQKPKSNFKEVSATDDNSSGDPFDSGTSSDVDSLPTFIHTKKGNVIVTIKSLQEEELKKEALGHRRAESLTSSGVGVDSEESDDEKSNISCDSLNSSEPYAQSNSEDHGYHTPNFEDKIGSPVDGMVYENVMKRTDVQNKPTKYEYEQKIDVINEMTDTTDKMKNLRVGDQFYAKKIVEPSDFEEYENVHVFENKAIISKKKSVSPPPQPPSLQKEINEQEILEADEDNQKCLPKNLLRDIRLRNVRLSSTYPNGESKQEMKTSVTEAILNLESNIPKKEANQREFKATKKDEKQGSIVEERTYEDRKTNVKSVKVNRICAMEVDTDQFYKFHLSENFREDDGNEDETFAGIKDYLSQEKPSAITSAKGTIRGVKNRVKAGIATFLQMHENKVGADEPNDQHCF